MCIRRLFVTLLLVCVIAGPAFGVQVIEEKKPAVGATFKYSFVPSFFLSPGYSKFTSISAVGYGVYSSYGFNQFDLQWSVMNWNIFMGEGEWLARGDEKIDTFHVESSLGMATIAMSPLWKWRVHPAVEPYVGPTLGVGFLHGDLDVDESDENGDPLDDPHKKMLPPVVPIGGFETGCRFYPHPNVRLTADLGMLNGFFFGVTAGYVF